MLSVMRTWIQRTLALHELKIIQRGEQATVDSQRLALLEQAQSLYAQGNIQGARQRLQEIRSIGGASHISPPLLQLLLDLKEFDEAEANLQQAHKRKPRDRFLLEGLARVAQQRDDLDVAIARWAKVRKYFPTVPSGYAQGGACLAKAKRFADADSLLKEAVRKFANDVVCHLEYAKAAEACGDLEGALMRWQKLRILQGGDVRSLSFQLGTIGIAQALRKSGRLDEAESFLNEMRAYHPLNILPAIELAGIAQDRGDIEETIRRWHFVKSRFPLSPIGYSNLVILYKRAGSLSEAENVLKEAIGRFADDFGFACEYADLADRSQDWETSLKRWSDVQRRFPGRGGVRQHIVHALKHLGRTAEATKLPQPPDPAPVTAIQ